MKLFPILLLLLTIPARAFLIFDATYGPKPTTMPTGVSPALWGHVSLYNRQGRGPNTQSVSDFADAVQRGDRAYPGWAGAIHDLSAKSLVVFDVEGLDESKLGLWFQAFRAHAPGVRLTSYGYPINGLWTREQFISPSIEDKKAFAAVRRLHADSAAVMDCICPEVYMLGPAYVDRDLRYIAAVIQYCHTYYPGKPVYLWTWGAYHTSWNPDHSLFSADVLTRFVKAIRKADGCVVWGPWEDNEALVRGVLEGQR